MASDILTIDAPAAHDPGLDSLRPCRLFVGDLEAASWGTSWQPDAHTRPAWLRAEAPDPADREAPPSAEAREPGSLLDHLGP